jgi:hypothetical protein
MTFINEGIWDRAIRTLAGLALGYVAWTTWPEAGLLSAPLTILFLVVGAVAFVTGIVGWCPLYTLLHVSTRKRVGA